MIDVLRVPQRFKQHVAKTHGHQVLHGFFTKVMINAVNLPLVEMRGQRCIQGARRFKIAAKGLFHDNARIGIRHTPPMQSLCKVTEKRG